MTDKRETIVKAIEDKLGRDIVTIDFDDSSVADAFILTTGNAPSHTQAIADAVSDALEEQGMTPMGTEGYREGNWILLDYGDVIVHVFLEQDRAYYALEKLWQDQTVTHLKED